MLDLSDSTDPEIGLAGQVLAALNDVAADAGAEFLVVGATARNILSAALLGRLPLRATRDVDIAVAVPDWAAYRRLTAPLIPRGAVHAFAVNVSGVTVEVDIVPYGGVEGPDRAVRLPEDHSLNVLGVREAFAAADTARLPVGSATTDVRVPTVAGLVLLKFVAWADRRLQHRRDAVDLDELIGWYAEGPFVDALFTDQGLLSAYDFELELVGAHRLGRDVAKLLDPAAAQAVLDLLGEDDLSRLAADMGRVETRNPRRLQALARGLREPLNRP